MNKYHITNEQDEDTFDSTDDIEEAISMAKASLSNVGDLANVEEKGKVIKQFTLTKNGSIEDVSIVEIKDIKNLDRWCNRRTKLDDVQVKMLKKAYTYTVKQPDLDLYDNTELKALIWLRDNGYLIVHNPSFGLSASGKGREYIKEYMKDWHPKI